MIVIYIMKISLSDILQRPVSYKRQQAPQSLLEKIVSYYTKQSKRKSIYHALIVNLIIPLLILMSMWLFFFGGIERIIDKPTPIQTIVPPIEKTAPLPSSLELDIFQSLENIFSGAQK